MQEFAGADGRCSDNQGAIGHGFGDALEFLRVFKHLRGTYGGARFAKGYVMGIYHAQAQEAKVAHGASGAADV